jgi:TonB family protein
VPPPRIEPPPVVKPAEPPPVVKAEPMQAVFAPVAPAAADPRDREGIPARPSPALETDSRGPGNGTGTGSGQGSGLGEGDGSGIGPGSGGGTGGGPYRPGAGIEAPRLIKEVRPLYTDEARRRGIQGDVVLEVVVTRSGSVDRVSVVRGLGAGLDQNAIAAVKQWKFDPARRQGAAVDVVVEIAVEFTMRDF